MGIGYGLMELELWIKGLLTRLDAEQKTAKPKKKKK